jgi:hypothetical protein
MNEPNFLILTFPHKTAAPSLRTSLSFNKLRNINAANLQKTYVVWRFHYTSSFLCFDDTYLGFVVVQVSVFEYGIAIAFKLLELKAAGNLPEYSV